MAKQTCKGCGAALEPNARFCGQCGMRVTPDSTATAVMEDPTSSHLEEFESRESSRLSREYFERHLEILGSYRKQLKQLARKIEEREGKLAHLAGGQVSQERTRAIQSELEAVEACGDEWADLQEAYNQDSEVLDEEFQERALELEIDVEIPEDLQEKMSKELEVMTAAFDKIGEKVARVGTLGNQMIASGSGQWFGATSTGVSFGALMIWLLVGYCATVASIWQFGGMDLAQSLGYATPALFLPAIGISLFK